MPPAAATRWPIIMPPSLRPDRHAMRYAALLLIALSGPLLADECEQLPVPAVTFKRIEVVITQNTRYSYKSLTNIGASLTRPSQVVLGLTRGNAVVKFATATPAIIDKSGRWECISPQITISIGFAPMVLYVAREFPAGGCAYGEIYEHELRHVKTYQAHIGEIEKDLLATLNTRFATGGPWRGPVGQKRAQLLQELDERWLPYIERRIASVDAAQALIDTPEEYERVANACNGEIRKAIAKP